VIGPVVPPRFVDEATRFIINPSGRWVWRVAAGVYVWLGNSIG
jgi:S-adenosylmethionine synthetase